LLLTDSCALENQESLCSLWHVPCSSVCGASKSPEGPERPMAPLNWSSPLFGTFAAQPQLRVAHSDPGSSKENKTMKTTLFLLCFLSATLSFGQNSAGVSTLSNEPQMVSFYSHSRQATQQNMSQEQNLLERSGFTYAQGERPLWEVAPKSHTTPLGDLARALRKEHETVKKADIIWQN